MRIVKIVSRPGILFSKKAFLLSIAIALFAFQSIFASTFAWNYANVGTSLTKGPGMDSLCTSGKMDWNCCATCYVDMLCVTYVQSGAIALLRNFDLKCGLSGMRVKVGRTNACRIIVHLDSASAPALCTLSVAKDDTTSGHNVQSAIFSPRRGSGVHNLFVEYSASSGYIGDFIWVEFTTGCERTTSSQDNWIPAGVPANNDTVSFSGAPANSNDTISWDLNIRPSFINLDAFRNVAVRFDALHAAGVDTLKVGKISMLQGHLIAPTGFVIAADEVDTNNIPMSQGAYTSFFCRFGLAHKLSFGGGGTLLVTQAVGVLSRPGRISTSSAGAIIMLENGRITAKGASAACIDLYSIKGILVRHGGAGVSAANLPAGSYIVRALVKGQMTIASILIGERAK